jgi:hypothetical protein
MTKCIAVSPFTMPAALAAADGLLGNPTWLGNPDNADQTAWLGSFRRRAELAAKMPEIHRNATTSAQQHVAWLKSEGWEAQITQGTPNDIFLASTLNIVAKWRAVGHAYKEGEIDRVLLKKGAYTSAAKPNEHPLVEVAAQHESFSFCFQQVDMAPTCAAELTERALDMVCRATAQVDEEVHLDFPMVDLLVRDDAKYIHGLHAGLNVVTQAAEQLRLELNEIGGRASAAAEIAVTRGIRRTRTIKIAGPFMVAINRNGTPSTDKVMFAAYVDRDAWKKPAAGRI